MKRTFIAVNINVSEELQKAYDYIYQKLKFEKINWVPTDNLHITLNFLGDTDETLINAVSDKIMLHTNQYNQFKIDIFGLGVFKNLNDPRVIWMGCGNSNSLAFLSNDFNKELASLKFNIEKRPFRPHLTIGRIKYIREINKIAQLISNYKNVKFQTQLIDKVILYESILMNGKINYKVIKEFYLNEKYI